MLVSRPQAWTIRYGVIEAIQTECINNVVAKTRFASESSGTGCYFLFIYIS